MRKRQSGGPRLPKAAIWIPDEVIVMNEIYRDEIGRDLAAMGVDVPLVSADRTMQVPA